MRFFSTNSIDRKLVALIIFAIGAFALIAKGQTGASSISGSYAIDTSASEDPAWIVRGVAQRQNLSSADQRDLSAKLEAPATFSIYVNGNNVTIEAAGSAPVTVQADGVARRAPGAGDSTASLRASFRGNSLNVSRIANSSDFTLVFTPIDDGSKLSVTRRVTTPYLSETVFAESVYSRTSGYSGDTSSSSGYPRDDNASTGGYGDDDSYSSSSSSDSGGYSDSAPPVGGSAQPVNGNYAVAPGAVMSGRLENLISTRATQENDPFRITVDSPSEFAGAVIEGYVTGIERTGRVAGRSKLTLNFRSITLRDGRTYDFAGVVTGVTAQDGENLSVNDEGQVEGGSRTRETLKRSGVGAGLGAIIGGILGGGKGALIGATIGAGAGAGSMIPGGRGDLEIEQGSTITISATGPGGR